MATIAVNMNTSSVIEPLIPLDEAARILGRSHWSLRHDFKAG
jgi:hypothetical protein